MKFRTRSRLSAGHESGLPFICLVLTMQVAAFAVTDEPIRSSEPAIGAEVVLKIAGTPLFDQGRQVSSRDQLTFLVDRVAQDRILIVSRDATLRGWVFRDQIVPLEQADEHFARVVANDPRDAEAFWIHARVLHYRHDSERALANVNRAIHLEPDQASYYVTRALVQLGRQQPDRAIEDCDQAIQIDPRLARPYSIRAQAWLSKNDATRARADLEMALRLDPTNPFFPVERRASVAQADNAKTVTSMIKVSGHDGKETKSVPESAAELVKQGEDRLASNEYDKALADFNEAIRLNPDHAPAYVARAQAWAKKHYRDREIADYNEAVRRDPANAAYHIARAESWSAQGMHENAMADFDTALRMEPNNPSFWISRGNEWRRDLKFDDALADYTHALQINRRYAPGYFARGMIWQQRQMYDRAIQEFSELIRVDPENPLGHMLLARLLATCYTDRYRNGKLAVEEGTRASELTQWRDPDCLDTLAAACAEAGDFTSAIKWQTQAVKLSRQNVRSLLQQRAISSGGRRGVGFEDRLAFYKSKKPTRE
jgi:tetratricopeptide (TPR) repeat protein